MADAIKEEFGGIINESPRLISQDKSTGKGLYRIWILIRLPKFKKGDFIKYNDKYWEIINIDGKRILIQDLDTFEKIPLQWKEYENIEYIKEEKKYSNNYINIKIPFKHANFRSR
ncbi:NMD3-related protein [Methanobrevibacter arboriphilus]|uniref:NMD3-related protein n=1 Tax=Methanobrevibacter arboriphilus TaxID=39441 RepID=UPI0021E69D70|nr:NMD3-related protein [Methanobrevibacter arboriphilus]